MSHRRLRPALGRLRTIAFGSPQRRLATAAIALAGVGWAGVGLASPGTPHPSPVSAAIAPSAVAPSVAAPSVSPSASAFKAPPNKAPAAVSPRKTVVAKSTTKAAARVSSTSATAAAKLARVIREVKKLAGSPYVWGATGPDTFDCAGLTQFVYAKVGVKLVNYVPTQKDKAKLVPRSQARPGDLLFFMSGDFAYHVGIYAGYHKMYDAPTEGQTVGLHEIWDDGYLVGRLV